MTDQPVTNITAYVTLRLDSGEKTLSKSGKDEKILIDWLVRMSDNDRFYMGWTDNGSTAILKGSCD
ncbi:MAG: hypothetical protein WC554_16270 [Clostridia bacterium]